MSKNTNYASKVHVKKTEESVIMSRIERDERAYEDRLFLDEYGVQPLSTDDYGWNMDNESDIMSIIMDERY